MIADIVFKLLRKSLHPALYRKISKGALGRGKKYYKPATYAAIFKQYCDCGLEFRDRVVLEVGPGRQVFTALYFLANGAREALIADPVADPSSLAEQLEAFNAYTGKNLGPETLDRIRVFKNIQEVPSRYDARVDLICSFHVLEHLPEIRDFFANHRRLLSKAGLAYHRVDISDHTYQYFDRFSLTRRIAPSRSLYHLRYSQRTFGLLNDGKCYMNRILLPGYLQEVHRQELRVSDLWRVPYRQVPVHPDLVSRFPGTSPDDLFLTEFSFKLTQAGSPGRL